MIWKLDAGHVESLLAKLVLLCLHEVYHVVILLALEAVGKHIRDMVVIDDFVVNIDSLTHQLEHFCLVSLQFLHTANCNVQLSHLLVVLLHPVFFGFSYFFS